VTEKLCWNPGGRKVAKSEDRPPNQEASHGQSVGVRKKRGATVKMGGSKKTKRGRCQGRTAHRENPENQRQGLKKRKQSIGTSPCSPSCRPRGRPCPGNNDGEKRRPRHGRPAGEKKTGQNPWKTKYPAGPKGIAGGGGGTLVNQKQKVGGI